MKMHYLLRKHELPTTAREARETSTIYIYIVVVELLIRTVNVNTVNMYIFYY